jgi:hypothetical protein
MKNTEGGFTAKSATRQNTFSASAQQHYRTLNGASQQTLHHVLLPANKRKSPGQMNVQG